MTPATIDDVKNLLWTIQDNLAGMGDDSWSLRLDIDSLACLASQLEQVDAQDLSLLMEETTSLQKQIDSLEKHVDSINHNLTFDETEEEESK